MGNQHADLNEIKKSKWDNQAQFIEKIKSAGGFGKYFLEQNQDNLGEIFQNNGKVTCIDEGTPDGSIRMAGSGIGYVLTYGFAKGLEGWEAFNAGLEAAANVLKDQDIKEITSHKGCGAAGLVHKEMSEEIKKQYSPDQLGKLFSQKLAEKLRTKYTHIEELKRPEDFHDAMVTLLVDGHCNVQEADGLPQAFVVSSHLDPEQAVIEAGISMNIATGNHGLGELITKAPGNQMQAVAISQDQGKVAFMKDKLQKVAGQHGEKIKVDGFILPQ